MTAIPNLVDTPFRRIVVDLSVSYPPAGEFSSCIIDEENGGPFYACIPGEKDAYAMFVACDISSAGDDGVCAKLVLTLDEPPKWPYLAEDLFESLPPPPADWPWKETNLDFINHALQELFLEEMVEIFVKSSFLLGRDQLPAESLVAPMIGLQTKVGEEQLLMSGAQFAVRSCPKDTISWYLVPGSVWQEVAGELVRGRVEKFRWESISDAIHVIEARFNRIVRAQINVKPPHAAS